MIFGKQMIWQTVNRLKFTAHEICFGEEELSVLLAALAIPLTSSFLYYSS